MLADIRAHFNAQFDSANYEKYLSALGAKYPNAIDFRVAETPIFIDHFFKSQLLNTCEAVIDIIASPHFKTLTDKSIPPDLFVPNENKHPHFIAFDFGICENNQGEIVPQLIEMQGFPSLFAYQIWHEELTRQYFSIPQQYSSYLNNYEPISYTNLLKEIIIGSHLPEEVVLLEILPHEQKTKIDFYCTTEYTGISVVCITELIKEGSALYYKKGHRKIQIKRIYNRIIFDELQQQHKDIQEKGQILFEPLDIEWVTHPNWFYRISKYLLPFIKHPHIPETFFLTQLLQIPADLENYVLKPLFSFAGQGVVIDVTQADINLVKDPENWILQRKVKYAPIIQTLDEPAKAEIRLFYFWKDGEARPVATMNLARLSKGKMIGVRYNQYKTWVGGSIAYFES